jgi:hypothetical protein
MNREAIRELRRHIREIEREVEFNLKDQIDCCGVSMAQCHVLRRSTTWARRAS